MSGTSQKAFEKPRRFVNRKPDVFNRISVQANVKTTFTLNPRQCFDFNAASFTHADTLRADCRYVEERRVLYFLCLPSWQLDRTRRGIPARRH
jgi:hypothetical protein